MQASFRSAELLMEKGQTLELGDVARSVITGIRGSVSVTRKGQGAARVLQPGESIGLGAATSIRLDAAEEASIRVEQRLNPHRSGMARAGRRLQAAYLRYLRASRRRFAGQREASQAY